MQKVYYTNQTYIQTYIHLEIAYTRTVTGYIRMKTAMISYAAKKYQTEQTYIQTYTHAEYTYVPR